MNTDPKTFLRCIDTACGATYPIDQVLFECDRCGNLLDILYDLTGIDASALKQTFLQRKLSRDPRDLSGVWRFRELIPFLPPEARIISLREGNTPLLPSRTSGEYAGLPLIHFKHQGFNPTGSFKDNGMTAGVSQGAALGRKSIACVSTGNTSASLAAYASYGGMQAVIFIPVGHIAVGKLAQSLDYGALTIQVEANFDGTWQVVRNVLEQAGIYLLNSVNPFRIEGQKTIIIEAMEQLDWEPPDWIVLPGGNLGNTSAFGKGLRELFNLGFLSRMPRLAVIQAEGAAPLHRLLRQAASEGKDPAEMCPPVIADPATLASAIKIGAPVSWKKAVRELAATKGVCEIVSEQEIADAKAVIGRSGIGCEPASAASLAGTRKLVASGVIAPDANVVAVLTGNSLKDTDYTLAYHQGELKFTSGQRTQPIEPRMANQPVVVPPDSAQILTLLRKSLH